MSYCCALLEVYAICGWYRWDYCPPTIAGRPAPHAGTFQRGRTRTRRRFGRGEESSRSRERSLTTRRWLGWFSERLTAIGIPLTPSAAMSSLARFPERPSKNADAAFSFASPAAFGQTEWADMGLPQISQGYDRPGEEMERVAETIAEFRASDELDRPCPLLKSFKRNEGLSGKSRGAEGNGNRLSNFVWPALCGLYRGRVLRKSRGWPIGQGRLKAGTAARHARGRRGLTRPGPLGRLLGHAVGTVCRLRGRPRPGDVSGDRVAGSGFCASGGRGRRPGPSVSGPEVGGVAVVEVLTSEGWRTASRDGSEETRGERPAGSAGGLSCSGLAAALVCGARPTRVGDLAWPRAGRGSGRSAISVIAPQADAEDGLQNQG